MNAERIIQKLDESLPTTFTRRYVCQAMGGYLTPGGLANLDSMGKGPKGVRAGKTVLYEKQSFLEWLAGRLGAEVGHA